MATDPRQETVTRLLGDLQDGRREALDELLPLVYAELRELASRQRRRLRAGETLDTTALVHEAYLRLAGQEHPSWRSGAHFKAVASKAMRQILIDYARRQYALKRGGAGAHRISLGPLESVLPQAVARPLDTLLALEEALIRLQEVSERESRIVECRFFGDMTIRETAAALKLSPATVKRGWAVAQAWLHQELGRAS